MAKNALKDLEPIKGEKEAPQKAQKETTVKKTTAKKERKDDLKKSLRKQKEEVSEVKKTENKKKPQLPKKKEAEQLTLITNPPMKVLFAVSEALPFIATGGLGEVAGSLPHALTNCEGEKKADVRVILPLYSDIKRSFENELTFIGNLFVPLAWRNLYCGVFKAERRGVIYYFIDNEYYFSRPNIYGHFDDGERFAFFSKAVLTVLPVIDFFPDILHCHDWQTALIPVYLKTKFMKDSRYFSIKSVFTIHNIEYQGKYSPAILGDVFDLSYDDFKKVEYDGCINLMKGAIECADKVTTVSKSYVEEIKDEKVSFGLSHIINRYAGKFQGILNGIDTESYDPEKDSSVFQNYGTDTLSDKVQNKRMLREMLSLPQDDDIPLLAVISRLVGHKGMDLITEIADEILYGRIQLVVLGKGDRHYEDYFEFLERSSPAKVRTIVNFNSDLARKIYAAADIFLMPSKSEPCGLSQMIAARYGAVPVVRETGGLKDSIKDCTLGEGNGFTFKNYSGEELKDAINRVLNLYYNNKPDFKNLQKAAMLTDFSWNQSARKYMRMYEELTGRIE